MNLNYKSTEFGWIMIFIFSTSIIGLSITYWAHFGQTPLPMAPYFVICLALIFILLLFYKMDILVYDDHVKIKYGIGLIYVKLNIKTLIHIRVIQIPFYYGLGIKYTRKGSLFNIQSAKTIKIFYKNGKKKRVVMIGTPYPNELKSALEQNFKSRNE